MVIVYERATARCGCITPNHLLAAAGWDELPGQPVMLRAGPDSSRPRPYGLVSAKCNGEGESSQNADNSPAGSNHRGAVGLNGETKSRTGLKWVISTGGSAIFVRSAFVDALLDRAHRFSRQRWIGLQIAACEARYLAAANARDPAVTRVAALLLSLNDQGARGAFFSISQEEIARLMAIRRTTVCAVMLDLKRSGAVGYSRSKVRVLDRQKLVAIRT